MLKHDFINALVNRRRYQLQDKKLKKAEISENLLAKLNEAMTECVLNDPDPSEAIVWCQGFITRAAKADLHEVNRIKKRLDEVYTHLETKIHITKDPDYRPICWEILRQAHLFGFKLSQAQMYQICMSKISKCGVLMDEIVKAQVLEHVADWTKKVS